MNLLSLIGDLFKPAVELVDNLHTSEDEKLTAKAVLLNTQAAFMSKALEYENDQLQARSKIIEAEAKSNSTLTRIWRPVTMLTFLALLVATWMGWTQQIPMELQLELMSIIKIGLGGYIVGRSVEKVAPPVVRALKSKEST